MVEQYDGKDGYGRIGDMAITSETSATLIVKQMSSELIGLITKAVKSKGVKFNPFTYVSANHGELETIKDLEGGMYGFDHGSCKSWGF